MNIPGYDAWKLQAPGDGPYDPPEFRCEDCEDEGCPRCDATYDDPTLWCNGCGARAQEDCHCGPIADNNTAVTEDEEHMSEIDTTNKYMVAAQGANVIVMMPPRQMTADEAMVFAAYLVAMASMQSSHPFSEFYDKVCNT